jgi:hypothetical protein
VAQPGGQGEIKEAMTMSGTERSHGTGRLLAGLAWLVLLLGVWQWGGAPADAPPGPAAPATGDMAAVGRPAHHAPSHAPRSP